MDNDFAEEVAEALTEVRYRTVDRDFVSQARLDVVARDRVSAFPWRGQFTPGLVDALLSSYAQDGMVVLDPFAGSGTTIAEAGRRGLQAIGVEVNPAAVELARVFSLIEIPLPRRKEIAAEARQKLTGCLLRGDQTLFGESENNLLGEVLLAYKGCDTPEAANLVAVNLMLAMGDTSKLDRQRLQRAVSQVYQVVDSLPGGVTRCCVQAGDARKLPLPAGSVDLVITSPPYINVFNYHQNYRPAIESLGWQVLPSARSEIGSNRKHRQNRFLTVIQYCLDMFLALQDLVRVCKSGSKIVIVVGRESRVRGVSFANGEIIGCLAEFVPQVSFVRWQERQFINRFGETIYEEILTFEVTDRVDSNLNLKIPGALGCQVLREGLLRATSAEVRNEIEEAVSSSDNVLPSPDLAVARRNSG